MKVFIITPNLRFGGSEKVVSLIGNELNKTNDVFTIVFDNKKQSFKVNSNIYDLNAPASENKYRKLISFLKRVFKIIKFIKRHDPDHIISFTESANYVAIICCIFTRKTKRLRVSVRTNLNFYPTRTKLLVYLFYNFANKIIAQTNGAKEGLKNIGIKENKIQVINNPIRFRAIKNIFEKRQYILSVGRLSHEKGFDLLLRSIKKTNNKNIRLVIVGDGEEKNKLIKLSKKLNIENKIKFVGYKKQMRKWYLNAKFLVLSSHYEGFPNVIIEAMSFACPVISFDCDYGPKEIIKNENNGILVPQGNIKLLSKEINRLYTNSELNKKLSYNCYKDSKLYDVSKIAQKWIN